MLLPQLLFRSLGSPQLSRFRPAPISHHSSPASFPSSAACPAFTCLTSVASTTWDHNVDRADHALPFTMPKATLWRPSVSPACSQWLSLRRILCPSRGCSDMTLVDGCSQRTGATGTHRPCRPDVVGCPSASAHSLDARWEAVSPPPRALRSFSGDFSALQCTLET